MLRKLAVFASLVVLTIGGCSHNRLRPDNSPLAALEAFEPTAEGILCGKRFHKLAVCAISKGDFLNSLGFYVQGYFKGEVRVAFSNTIPDQISTYSDHSLLHVVLPGLAQESFTVGFTNHPVYPNQDKFEHAVWGFEGYAYIKVLDEDGTPWEGFTSVLPEGSDREIELSSEEITVLDTQDTDVYVYMNGCGYEYERRDHPVSDGAVRLKLSDIVRERIKSERPCILEGFVEDSRGAKELTWMIAIYDKRYVPLATPVASVTLDGETSELKVEADGSVSVVCLDNKCKISNKMSEKFNASLRHTVRVLTVKGRSKVGEILPGEARVRWMP